MEERASLSTRPPDRGSALLIAAMVLWLAAGICYLLATLAAVSIDDARAQAAADATALAAAAHPPAASVVAAANGARVIDTARSGAIVTVVVHTDTGASATAAAVREEGD